MTQHSILHTLYKTDAYSLIRNEIQTLLGTGQVSFCAYALLPIDVLAVEFEVNSVFDSDDYPDGHIFLAEIDAILAHLAELYLQNNLSNLSQLTDAFLSSKLIQVRSVAIANAALIRAAKASS